MTSTEQPSKRSGHSKRATCSSRWTTYIASHASYSDFDPALFKYASYKDKTYFIPIGWNNIMINYNRKLFKDAGVEFPKTGWTWDEFREDAKKLTVRDAAGNVTQFGYEVPNQFFFVQPWFFSNGTSIAERRLDRVQHARPEGVRVAAVPLRPDPRGQSVADSR